MENIIIKCQNFLYIIFLHINTPEKWHLYANFYFWEIILRAFLQYIVTKKKVQFSFIILLNWIQLVERNYYTENLTSVLVILFMEHNNFRFLSQAHNSVILVIIHLIESSLKFNDFWTFYVYNTWNCKLQVVIFTLYYPSSAHKNMG